MKEEISRGDTLPHLYYRSKKFGSLAQKNRTALSSRLKITARKSPSIKTDARFNQVDKTATNNQ
jgi:hypothetical protein